MHVTACGSYDKLVIALVFHMCEQDVGIVKFWRKERGEMMKGCREQNVQKRVRDFANALLHHEYTFHHEYK